MSRALTTPQAVLDWGPTIKGLEAEDPNLVRCLEAASVWIERTCRRLFLSGTYSAWHSGNRCALYDDTLYLADPVTRFPVLPVTAVSSITEDGVALTVVRLASAASWADGEAAVVSDARGTIRRATISGGKISFVPWASGVANIRVVCTAGYTARDPEDGAAGTMPDQIEQLCCEVTRQFHAEGRRTGVEGFATDGIDARFVRLLSPLAKAALDQFRFPGTPGSPVTVES